MKGFIVVITMSRLISLQWLAILVKCEHDVDSSGIKSVRNLNVTYITHEIIIINLYFPNGHSTYEQARTPIFSTGKAYQIDRRDQDWATKETMYRR